jgi:hypothetical protein
MVAMRPAFRLALRVLLIFVAVWAAWEVWYRIELRRYQKIVAPVLAEANAASELLPDADSDDDAARYYSAAAVAAIGEQPSQPLPPYLIGLVQRTRAAYIAGTNPSVRDVELAQHAVARSETSIQLADRGAALPFRRFAPGTSFSYRMSGMVGVHAALALRTLDAIRSGDRDGAATAIHSRLRLMRALDHEIFPANEKARQMSELAADIGLWLGLQPSDATLETIAAALEEPYRRDDLVATIAKQARFWWGNGGADVRRVGWLAPLFLEIGMGPMRAVVRAMDAVRQPWPQRLTAIRQLPLDGNNVIYGAQSTTVNVAIGIASNRASRIAIAAEQGRRRGDTASPLSRGRVSGDVSLDPFTGEPLRVVMNDAGVVVYSVGANGKDDGGNVDIPANGRAPNVPQGADVGVRVRRGRS